MWRSKESRVSEEKLEPVHAPQHRLRRTELWVARQVFESMGWLDDVAGHIALARRLGMDYLFLPGGEAGELAFGLNYRRFSPREVWEAARSIPTGVVLDGPFGRQVTKRGLAGVLRIWKKGDIREDLEDEAGHVAADLAAYLGASLWAVVIADDIAYQQATYVDPNELRRWLFPLYRPLVENIHASGAYALFHSDGKLQSVFPDLLSAGFDGLAGCQMDCQREGLISDGNPLVLWGINGHLLEADISDLAIRLRFLEEVNALKLSGRLILCSSTGIASLAQLERLETLYGLVDEAVCQ